MRVEAAVTIALALSIVSCCASVGGSTSGGASDGGNNGATVDSTIEISVRSGYCRIIGTVVEINPARISTDPRDPCSRGPCRGRVRIESIVEVGDNFPPLLFDEEDIVVMTFASSLAPIDDTFNGLRISYPGLHVNSRFRADVAYNLDPNSSEPATENGSLTVYGYRPLPP